MASYLFGKGRERFAGKTGPDQINWLVDAIKVFLFDNASKTAVQNTDEFLTDYSTSFSADIIATSSNLASKTNSLGLCGAANVVFSTVSGDQFEYVIGYKDTGTPATSPLIFKIDDYTGLPCTPNGSNINLTWPTPIFTL